MTTSMKCPLTLQHVLCQAYTQEEEGGGGGQTPFGSGKTISPLLTSLSEKLVMYEGTPTRIMETLGEI